MRDNDWDILVRSLQRRNCILFVGPNVQFAVGDPLCPRTDSLLAQCLASDMGETWNAAESLSGVALRYLQRYSRDDLQWRVEDFIHKQQPDAEYFAVLSELAALPFYLVVTSLYDSVLQTAFRCTGKEAGCRFLQFPGRYACQSGDRDRTTAAHLPVPWRAWFSGPSCAY